jgi:hypothetical protein
VTWIATRWAGGLGRLRRKEITALVVVLKVAILQGNPPSRLNLDLRASVSRSLEGSKITRLVTGYWASPAY